MKKHTLYIVLICCCFFGEVKGQTANWFVDGSVWWYSTTESYEPGMCTTQSTFEQDSIQGDTLINSLTYKKLFVTSQADIQLYPPCWAGGGLQPVIKTEKYLRYDTLSKKVFMINDTGTFIPEILLYNFNLVAGNAVPLNNSSWGIVDSVKNISFFGVSAKEFYMPGNSNFNGNYIIEGVGGSNGLTFCQPEYGAVISGEIYMTELQCFKSGDSTYPSGVNCNASFNITVGNKEINNPNSEILISPNPSTGIFTIHTEGTNIKEIKVFTVLGEEVGITNYKLRISPSTPLRVTDEVTMDMSGFAKGIYFVQITVDSAGSPTKNVVNKKVVVQ